MPGTAGAKVGDRTRQSRIGAFLGASFLASADEFINNVARILP